MSQLPRLDKTQKKLFAEILSDLGKLFFAAGVIGYFFPEIQKEVSPKGLFLAI